MAWVSIRFECAGVFFFDLSVSVGRVLHLLVSRLYTFLPRLHGLAGGFALGRLPGRLVDTGGRGFGGTDLGEGTFASGGGGQITRMGVGQFTMCLFARAATAGRGSFQGLASGGARGWLPGGLVEARGRRFGGTRQTVDGVLGGLTHRGSGFTSQFTVFRRFGRWSPRGFV